MEALPDNFVLLAEGVAANGLANVCPIHLAATDKAGVVSFGGHSAWRQVVDPEGARCLVPGLPLDRILPVMGFGDADLIKIDVEGHEASVLQGMQRIIAEARPMLLIESNAWAQRHEGYEVLLRDVERLGYLLFMLLDDGRAVASTSLDIQETCVVVYLAVPSELQGGRVLPTIRPLTLDDRLTMLAAQPALGAPHCWHAAHTVDRLESVAGRLPQLEEIRAEIRRNGEVVRVCREWGVPLPSWVE